MTVSHISKRLQNLPIEGQQNQRATQLIVYNLTAINLALAFNFFPLVPMLGWFNFGHANWAVSWIPDVVILAVLPIGYFLYWHFGALLAGLATWGCWWLYRRTHARRDRILLFLNLTAGLLVIVVRIILLLLDVYRDIV